MAPLKTFSELSMQKDKDLKNLKIPVKGPKGTSKHMRMKVTNAPGADDIKKAVNSGFKTDANRKAAFAKMNDSVQSADRKPEKYLKPDGKVGVRMVKTDKEVIKKEASVLKPTKPTDITKHARTLARNDDDYNRNKKKYIDKARAKVFRMYPKEETHDPKHIKQAIGIASDPRYKKGNMTGAVKVMNKLSKDIHKHPQVAAVLRKQNEMVDPMDLRGRPKKRDPNPESPYGMKHPLHPVNLAKKKAKEAEKAKKEDVDIDEALTMTQRMKKSRLMKRLKSRIKIGRDRARKKMAKKDTLEKRANRQARNQIASKLTRGIPKRELSFARKQEIEKRLDKPALKQRIKRLAKRLFKDVRKKEVQRKKG